MKRANAAYVALIVCCALPVLCLLGVLVRGERAASELENRPLTRFPAFSFSSFASGKFQDDLEHALGDQYPLGEQIKAAVLDAQNALTQGEGALLTAAFPGAKNTYAEIAPGYYHFAGDEHRIVERPWDEGKDEARLARQAQAFNAVTGVKKYIYFIRNSRSQDFAAGQAENAAVYERVRAAYRADGSACFAAEDYGAFCDVFYQTDHHWNHRGADRGYREILALLGVEEAPLEPQKEWTFDAVFNGSYARQTKLLCADEAFSVFSYPLSKMQVTLNGKRGQYGHQALYEKQKYPTDALRNHYAYYYGGDYGEIVIDSGRATGRNLLLVADSYSNPINMLLASHFEKTFVIDLRYYQQDRGEEFDWQKYIDGHGVDTVLLLGDVALFAGAQEGEATE